LKDRLFLEKQAVPVTEDELFAVNGGRRIKDEDKIFDPHFPEPTCPKPSKPIELL